MSGNCVPGTEGPKDTVITTREEQAALVQQARADALREAAGMAASWHDSADCDPCDCLKAVSANILSLIDQPQEEVCEWVYDDNEHAPKWDSKCGESWCFIEGGAQENNVRYCQGCGKPVKVEEAW